MRMQIMRVAQELILGVNCHKIEKGNNMYSFNKEQIKSIQVKAINCLGQPMKYKEICEKLEIPYQKQTDSKRKQLRDLQTVLEIQGTQIGKQSGYIITQIYSEPQLPYYDDDEWYAAVKSRIRTIFNENPDKNYLWFFRSRLLYEIGAVNENYRIIMNPRDKAKLSIHFDREFNNEKAVCEIAGNIIADRIYDALVKMQKERLIICSDGYAIKATTNNFRFDKAQNKFIKKETPIYIDVPYDPENDSLFKYLYRLDNEALDEVAKVYNSYCEKDDFKNRSRVKGAHFEEFLDVRNKLFQDEEVFERIKREHENLISIEKFFDVKFITPVWKVYEKTREYKPFDKAFINKASQEKILNSKDKRLNRYKELIDGVVKIFISNDTEVNYKKMLKELDDKGINIFFTN